MSPPRGRILIVDDEEEICDALSRIVANEDYDISIAHDGKIALELLKRESPDAVLLDIRMPGWDGMETLRRIRQIDSDLPVIMVTALGSAADAMQAMRAGADDYLAKPFRHADIVLALHRVMNDRGLRRTVRVLSDQVREAGALQDLMGPSDQVARISAEVARVGPTSLSVLITGPTGAGKDLVARAIHEASPRAGSPFVAVDCGAIPENLFESEIFGHEKGAFTGADRLVLGKLDAASGGTLFLDEIANLPLGCQAKLLRALQTNTLTRVGGAKPIRVDVRIVAATNADVSGHASNSFRQDLFFRLNEFAIALPALKERPEDIIYLAKRFLDLTNHELGKTTVRGFSPAAVEQLLRHDWPGNVRELRSVVRRAVLMADEVIDPGHLGLAGAPNARAEPPDPSPVPGDGRPLRELVRRALVVVERAALAETLKKTGGNKAEAARLLQVDYKTIHTKLKEYGIGNGKKER